MSEKDARGNGSASATVPGNGTMLGRGLRGRCPWCGGSDLFATRFGIRPRCPSCGLRLDRGEQDFWAGAWMLNLVGVETVFALVLGLVVVLLWPDVPWNAVMWAGVAGMFILPILLFRISRTLWLAIDLVLQPQRPSDFAGRR